MLKTLFWILQQQEIECSCTVKKQATENKRQTASTTNGKKDSRKNDKKGKMTLEEIADYIPALSFDELKEIEAEVMQLA